MDSFFSFLGIIDVVPIYLLLIRGAKLHFHFIKSDYFIFSNNGMIIE